MNTVPIMVVTGNGQRHTIPLTGWSQTEASAVALTYEASGFAVSTGFGRV
jgi:hypothetical protein